MKKKAKVTGNFSKRMPEQVKDSFLGWYESEEERMGYDRHLEELNKWFDVFFGKNDKNK